MFSDNSTVQSKGIVETLISNMNCSNCEVSVAYIASSPDPHRKFFKQTVRFYESIGVNKVEYLDLESNYNEGHVTSKLSASLIHLSGGDTYRFLYWLKHRGLDIVLRELAQAGKPIIGVSAGAIIMTSSIESACLCGDINNIGLSDTSGLGLVPFLFVPHSEKSIKEQNDAIKLAPSHNIVLCADTDALLINESQLIEHGQPIWV